MKFLAGFGSMSSQSSHTIPQEQKLHEMHGKVTTLILFLNPRVIIDSFLYRRVFSMYFFAVSLRLLHLSPAEGGNAICRDSGEKCCVISPEWQLYCVLLPRFP